MKVKLNISDKTLINVMIIIFFIMMIYLMLYNNDSRTVLFNSFENFTNQLNYSSSSVPSNILKAPQEEIIDMSYAIEGFENPNDKDNKNKSEERDENNIPTVKFPFKNIFDQNGKKLNIILLSAPFRGQDHDKLYQEYKSQNPKLHFMGISSYSEFPGKLSNPYESRYHEEKNHNYHTMATTWLNCFRDSTKYIDPRYNLPILDLSESDFKDFNSHKPDPNIKKEYDFIYICLKDNDKCTPGWQSYNRNWELAKKCLITMCRKFKLKGAIIGRENCKFTDLCSGIVKILPFLKYHEFQKELQKARFLFVPNIADASPRVIAEALCYDLRLLVNYNLLGGWKYVTSQTGEFFTDEFDVENALDKLTTNMDKYQPRQFFIENYGKERAGRKLANFIKQNYTNIIPDPKTIEYTTITI